MDINDLEYYLAVKLQRELTDDEKFIMSGAYREGISIEQQRIKERVDTLLFGKLEGI